MASKLQKEIVEKIVKTSNRNVVRNNKLFEQMTPAEKRVQIARDVLAQLASKRLVAEEGVWLSGINKDLFDKKDLQNDPELKTILAKVKQCQGCALGGMFMCAVEQADALKLSKLEGVKEYKEYGANAYKHLDSDISEDDAFSYMKKFFTKSQLEMIECAFERGEGARYSEKAINFVLEIDNPGTRMQLIMENIVANKGTFTPHKRPIAEWSTPDYQG